MLSPEAKNDSLEASKKKSTYLAKCFPNVMTEDVIEKLNPELVEYCLLPDPKEEDLVDIPVDTWFAKLAKMKRGSERMFPQL